MKVKECDEKEAEDASQRLCQKRRRERRKQTTGGKENRGKMLKGFEQTAGLVKLASGGGGGGETRKKMAGKQDEKRGELEGKEKVWGKKDVKKKVQGERFRKADKMRNV
ncbi:hypothetical protein Pcinc_037021 [Petrolisthes cinctipes]|uniref:Uncharacterized protein n=1 Tax=Petrolisthes cinctipes TaxID=88211 RepID=A0AAE1BUW8_PETCI|nr:hypothetical protein Pcinc_037021 [Petrolisthes cinctipes]